MTTHFSDEAVDRHPAAPGARPPVLRQLMINITDLKEHDHYDPNCSQCRNIQRYGKARPGGYHTDVCRKALIEKMDTLAV